jgi:hypothetical protein
MLRLYLKIETKPAGNIGKAEFKDLVVEFRANDVLCRYESGGVKYELSQKLTRPIDPSSSKYSVVGRKLSLEMRKVLQMTVFLFVPFKLAQVKPSGWKRPFKLESKATPKWLKTDFDRWDDELVANDSGDDNEVAAKSEEKGTDLRAALREVEEREKQERQARQKELEESLKKGVKPESRDVVGNVDLDGID